MSEIRNMTAAPQPANSRQTAQAADPAKEQRLRQAARQLEGLFVQTLLKSMRATVPESDLLDQNGEIKYYRQLYDEELADRAAAAGTGLGIADMIIKQVSPSLAPEAPMGRTTAPARHMAGSPISVPTRSPLEGRPSTALPAAIGVAAYRQQTGGDLTSRMVRLRRHAQRLGGNIGGAFSRFQPELARASAQTALDPALLLAVMVVESGGDPQARSEKGALGLMQIMPGTAAELGLQRPHEPAENVLAGARYLARMMDLFDQKLDLALAAYNAGPGAIQRHQNRIPPYAETRQYVQRVLGLYRSLQTGSGTDLALGRASE
jgi:soluble lytic murein transglycosylase-like protein